MWELVICVRLVVGGGGGVVVLGGQGGGVLGIRGFCVCCVYGSAGVGGV